MRRVLPAPNDRLMELLRAQIMPNWHHSSEESKEFFLEARHDIAAYPVALQEALVPLLENDEDRRHYKFLMECIEEDTPYVLINEYVAYHPYLATNTPNIRFLTALRCYPQLPTLDDYSTATGGTRTQITALLTVKARLREEALQRMKINSRGLRWPDFYSGIPLSTEKLKRPIHGQTRATVISETDLVQLIVDHPDKAGQIGDLIIERGTVDVEYISSIINSAAPAVSGGRL